jgi:hypothetical protein
MAFDQGSRPCLVLEKEEHCSLRGALFSLGYQLHDGPRTTRAGEVQMWMGSLEGGRQVHLPEVRRRDGTIAVSGAALPHVSATAVG